MTLRVRLLSLTLSMVSLVSITLTAVNLNNLADSALEVAITSSEMAGRQVQSFIVRRLSESSAAQPAAASTEEIKARWSKTIAGDNDLALLLEQTMVQSRSIVEINIGAEDGRILASSNPRQIGLKMRSGQDLRELRDAGIAAKTSSLLAAHGDYETRVPLGISGQKTVVFTTQILVSPAFLRAAIRPQLITIGIGSLLALALAFAFSWWLTNLAMRPLVGIAHLIDDITSGREPELPAGHTEEARELAAIQSKLSILGERYRDAKEDASQLRMNLEGVLEKLDAGTRKQFESQLALAQRLTAINSLTGRVAHEIKNPLNAISLRLEMLRGRIADDSPDSEPEFAILAEEVTRLDRVVRTFLDFNRPVELSMEDINPAELCREILHLLEPEAAAKGVILSLLEPAERTRVQGDSGLLRQAFLNIVVNSLEAMSGDGSLRVEITKNSETCVLRIMDTGPGIPADQRDKVFQLYFTTKPQGSGIGLAMTFRAIQLHGGTIEIEPGRQTGTAFRITLPLAGTDRPV